MAKEIWSTPSSLAAWRPGETHATEVQSALKNSKSRPINEISLSLAEKVEVNAHPRPSAAIEEPAMHTAVTEASIQRANAQFWEQMLAMHLAPVESGGVAAGRRQCIGVEHIVGSCFLSGAWNGCIEVRLSRGLALQATSAMLMQPLDEIVDGDLLDASKEIANMIAGTLKSSLPRPCAMSVPSAMLEREDFCALPRTLDSWTVFFTHEAGLLMVRVSEALLLEPTDTEPDGNGLRNPAEIPLEELAPAF
jgi:CheY-specific phosphatase CheX